MALTLAMGYRISIKQTCLLRSHAVIEMQFYMLLEQFVLEIQIYTLILRFFFIQRGEMIL